MIPAPTASPELIDSNSKLLEVANWLNTQPLVAVDTESNSMHAYRERICLLQFSAGGRDLLIDPLAVDDLNPLRPIFESKKIELIFHAAEYDLICLYRDYGWYCKNIFDTMIATRTLGWDKTGLANVLNKLYGITLDKRYQRANWGARPLPLEMLNYARLDTYYLADLRRQLLEALRTQNAVDEVREEFERIANASVRMAREQQETVARDDGFWRITKAHKLDDAEATRLQALYHYRQEVAARINRPVFKIIGDKTLMAIAQQAPGNRAELSDAGLSHRQIKRHGNAIFKTLRHAKSASPPQRPRRKRTAYAIQLRYDALRAWRKARARQRGVETDVILAREVLLDIAHHAPETLADLDAIDSLGPWRRAQYGPELVAVIAEANTR